MLEKKANDLKSGLRGKEKEISDEFSKKYPDHVEHLSGLISILQDREYAEFEWGIEKILSGYHSFKIGKEMVSHLSEMIQAAKKEDATEDNYIVYMESDYRKQLLSFRDEVKPIKDSTKSFNAMASNPKKVHAQRDVFVTFDMIVILMGESTERLSRLSGVIEALVKTAEDCENGLKMLKNEIGNFKNEFILKVIRQIVADLSGFLHGIYDMIKAINSLKKVWSKVVSGYLKEMKVFASFISKSLHGDLENNPNLHRRVADVLNCIKKANAISFDDDGGHTATSNAPLLLT